MATTFDLTGDLAAVADHCESITWRRPGSKLFATISHALQHRLSLAEAAVSNGRYLQSDSVWHLPAGELTHPPRPGDLLVDVSQVRHAILEVRTETLASRFRLVTRNLAVVHGFDEHVTLQRASYTRTASGAAKAVWIDLAAGVSAKIQPFHSEPRRILGTFTTVATHEVYLLDPSKLANCGNADHRIVDATGRIYRVVGLQKGSRIDQASVATVVLTSESI
jgi:hypothetical protein